jgi:23S rRNA (guanosine2251-2'-O)-methyltransferase
MRKPPTDESRLRFTHPSAIEHFLSHRPQWIRQLELDRPVDTLRGRLADLIQQASHKGVRIVGAPKNLRPGTGGEPLAAVLHDFPYADLASLLANLPQRKKVGLVALDHIQDPQNFGAICRSAEAFGASGVVFPKDRSASVTAAVVQASAGAVATLPLARVTNLGEALRKLKQEGFWVVGSDLAENSVAPWQIPDFDRWVLVVGAEGDGMTPLVRSLCDCTVQIPLPGKVQSLNASAATSALLYELTRPRPIK